MKTNPAARLAIYQPMALFVQENPGDYHRTNLIFIKLKLQADSGTIPEDKLLAESADRFKKRPTSNDLSGRCL